MERKNSLDYLFENCIGEEIKIELIGKTDKNDKYGNKIIDELKKANITVLSCMGASPFKPYYNVYIQTNKLTLDAYLSTNPLWLSGINKY